MPNAEAVLLEVSKISKHFGGVAALSDVSLTVQSGEVVALVGDNGAGKSTLVSMIAGIDTPDEGKIFVRGQDVSFSGPKDANRIGIQAVYQDLALCDNLDTVQNLFLGREIGTPWYLGGHLSRPAMEGRARKVLMNLNVKIPNLSTPAGALSGGQRQSVAICRSVLSEPDLIVLDEPTAALGVAQRKQVLALIEALCAQGRGVIVVSHDLADVQQVADRVVVLRLGRMVAQFVRGSYTRDHLVAAITGIGLN